MIAKSPDPATAPTAKPPSEELLAFIRALARRRARLDAIPDQPANENIKDSGGMTK